MANENDRDTGASGVRCTFYIFSTDRSRSQESFHIELAVGNFQPAADINEAPNADKRQRKEAEDFAIEGARLIGMTHSVNHATHQSHQTIKLKPA